MLEMFSEVFMQRALLASLLVGVIASFLSCFIVQRKMSFLGTGLAHASFGGIAFGLFLDVEPIAIAAPFTVFVSLAIAWMGHRTKLENDTLIGVFFSVSMALGVVFLSLRTTYSADAMAYLFGSILAVKPLDIYLASALFLGLLAFSGRWSSWIYASFDRELAQVDQVRVVRDDYILHFLIGLSVVVCLKILGIVLLAAFLVIPGAAAQLISKSFLQMILVSLVIGVSSSVVGLAISYAADLPSGASIILFQAVLFVFCFLGSGKLGTR